MIRKIADYSEVVAGFSTVADGTMAIDGGLSNRQKYLAARGCEPARTVHAGLCHGTNMVVVTGVDGGKVLPNTDGLMTAETNLGLAMTAADCLLISVFDPVNKIIGLVHAGSNGLAHNAVSVFLQTWLSAFSSETKNLLVDISPSICDLHYTVTPEQAREFSTWPQACRRDGDVVHLDLRQIAGSQLLSGGVPAESIVISPRCTFEDANYYSYRRDHPSDKQLQVGYLMRSA